MIQETVKLNYLKIAPRKVRSVANFIKGLSVNEAEAQLLLARRRASRDILKLLRSGVASAKNNKHLDPEKLIVKSIRVDQGPMLKRSLPRARGSASPIQKKMSHITLVLVEGTPKPPRFKIVVVKKSKLEKEKTKKGGKEKKETGAIEDKPARKRQDAGFFRKVFNRKAGMAK